MTFEQLHYFLEIVKDMNFTKTANRLYINPSTLSRQIVALEDALGAKLLVRTTRSVELTEAGQYLAQAAKKIFRVKREIEEHVWSLNEGVSGSINLSSIAMQTNEVYQLCHQFQIRYPNITLNLSTQIHGTTKMLIEQDLADVAIGFSHEMVEVPPEIECLPLRRDRFYLIVSENHPLAGRESVTAAELKGENFLIAREPISTDLCAEVHRRLGAGNEKKKDWMKPNTLEEMVMQVRANLGVAILPGAMCRADAGYEALRIEGIPTEFDEVVVWKKKSGNPSMACFKEVVREVLSARES